MLRRLIVIGLVLGTAALLMYLHNRVFTGTQELFADVVAVDEGTAYKVVFTDISERLVEPGAEEFEEVRRRLVEPGPKERDKQGPLPVGDLELDSANKSIRFRLGDAEDGMAAMGQRLAMEDRLKGRPFVRTNPPRAFHHINLGIDLQGGVEFSCALIDMEGQRVFADEKTVDILRKRLDAQGLTEPQVSRLGSGDVQIVIPGGTTADAARTRKVLETTGSLEFREVLGVFGDVGNTFKYQHKLPQFREPKGPDRPDGVIIDHGDGTYDIDPMATVENLAWLDRSAGEVIYPLKPEKRGEEPTVFLRLGPAELTGDDIASANIGLDSSSGNQAVYINFKAAGGHKNSAFTTRIKYEGKTGFLAVCMDRVVESAPIVESPSANSCMIRGRFSEEEAQSLQTVLTAGALRVRPEVQAERVVGASLGADSVKKGLVSMGVAVLVVLSVMLIYYLGLGTVAVASLVSCVALIYAVLVVFNATLTLPGIAGLVLTVGMAVDANILIFERIREELRDDVDLATSIDVGYSRAFGTILDANLTTFIAALILYIVGSAQVKGFGLTLMIGLATSMFAAIYLGRLLTEVFYRGREHARVAGFLRESWFRWNFVRWRHVALVFSLAVLAAGVYGLFRPGNFNRHFNIDFTGGHAVQVTFEEPLDAGAVDAVLAQAGGRDSLLDDLQRQAYYADFGTADRSRQWVFKTADVDGIAIEHELRAEEEVYVDLARQLRRASSVAQPDPAVVGPLQQRVDDQREKVGAIRDRLAERTELVKRELQTIFGGKIPAEGSEVAAAAWEDRTLTLDLEVLRRPGPAALTQLAARLPADHDELTTAAAEPLELPNGHPGIRFRLEFVSPPQPLETGKVTAAGDPVFQRLRSLLAGDEVAAPLLAGRADLALRGYEYATQEAAGLGLQVAQPFPATEHFSATVGDQTRWRALVALAIAIVAILLYIAARFEFTYGIGAVIALIHDVVLTVGLLMLLGIRIDLTVIAALLAIIGYSLNDTIVVFDRIREVRRRYTRPLKELIDLAISQTMSRTLLTSLTTIVVVGILFVSGGDNLKPFSATLLIGLVLGTYSSVYVASPILLFFQGRQARQRDAEAAAETAGRTPDAELPRPEF